MIGIMMKNIPQKIVLIMILLSLGAIFCYGGNSVGIDADKSVETLFPASKYTPNGYLSNPYHTAVLNRSGVLRSAPPLGFGYWARPLPWPYGGATFGFGLTRHRNYLSLMNFALVVDGKVYQSNEDFKNNGVEIYSDYHTKNMMNYVFELDGLKFRLKYFQVGEHSIVCRFKVENLTEVDKDITIHAINVFGDIYKGYWGCDGIVSRYNLEFDVAVSKFYADGDMFAIGADIKSVAYKATADDEELSKWITDNDLTTKKGYTSLRIRDKITEVGKSLGHMNNMMSYEYSAKAGQSDFLTFTLTRGIREDETVERYAEAVKQASRVLETKIEDDNAFYTNAPVLTGQWPTAWKHGFIYHQETIRMNIHPPIGIYKHNWDGMQVHTPRVVLGESAIDAMALSYGDINLAKDVLLGTFEDSPGENLPCSREDGSLNLVCGNGKETGTAPIWGLPFRVIRSIYLRDQDDEWITELYPHMKEYIEWWIVNRTDENGWFHCACSWESGQDGSKRFLIDDVAGSAENVRTIDIEAAMANAIKNMVLFADVAGEDQDVEYWEKMAKLRVDRTRAMFIDGRFRDFNAITGEPIILDNYYSVMMLAPISFDLATEEQLAGSQEIFEYFRDNYRFWLEWPSFLFPFTEAAWNAGSRELVGEVLANSGNGIFPGTDSREPLYVRPKDAPGLSEQFSYRLPGVAAEWWPYKRGEQWAGGCENYGWGATFPTLLIRNIIGFREVNDNSKKSFYLAPALSEILFEAGNTYGIRNLDYQGIKIDVDYILDSENKLVVKLIFKSGDKIRLSVEGGNVDEANSTLEFAEKGEIVFSGKNYDLFTINIDKEKSF